MLHTFENTSKYTARREQRNRLMQEMDQRSHSIMMSLVEVTDGMGEHERPGSPSSHSPSLISYENARQLVLDDDDDSLGEVDFRHQNGELGLSPMGPNKMTRHINLQAMGGGGGGDGDEERDEDPSTYKSLHGTSFMRLYSWWVSNFRCSRRLWIAVGTVVLLSIIVGCSVGLTQKRSKHEDPPPPAIPEQPRPPHKDPNSHHHEIHGLVSSILVHFKVLDVSKFEDRLTTQRQAVDYLSTSTIAHDLKRSHVEVHDWTSDPVLRQLIELYALSVFYFSTHGLNWVDQTNWLSSDDRCQYKGVSCVPKSFGVTADSSVGSGGGSAGGSNGNIVTNLSLSNNGLGGTLPTELALLIDLEVLSLANNTLGGWLPKELGHLGVLKELNLAQNRFQNEVPGQWAALRDLNSLDLHENELRGPIPWGWTSLTSLSLFHNFFTGSVPSFLGEALPNLEVLLLDTNRLSGGIPDRIGELSQLRQLRLKDNRLQGHVPQTLGDCQQLEVLDLAENNLSGEIFSIVTQLTSLTALALDNNGFNSSIPKNLEGLSNLRILTAEQNQFSGTISSSIQSLAQLQDLRLGRNQLHGSIPDDIGNLPNLLYLGLARNSIEGLIPNTLGQLTFLMTLLLEDNDLTGGVPPDLLALDHLESMQLHHNSLTGSMSFLCPLLDLSLQSFTADCYSEVNCTCCTTCF